jgi:hypothetical protein
MPQSGWVGVATPALAAVRSAEALIRTMGATSVQFCFPLPASASGDGAQLGLSQPQIEEITVAPVLVRAMQIPEEFKSHCELVIAASTLDRIVEQRAAGDLAGLLVQLATIRWNGQSFRVTKADRELLAGSEYLYHLQAME